MDTPFITVPTSISPEISSEQLTDEQLTASALLPVPESTEKPMEIGGPKGPEPTRYGDWENKGRCIDF